MFKFFSSTEKFTRVKSYAAAATPVCVLGVMLHDFYVSATNPNAKWKEVGWHCSPAGGMARGYLLTVENQTPTPAVKFCGKQDPNRSKLALDLVNRLPKR